jgi:hypothetical protein
VPHCACEEARGFVHDVAKDAAGGQDGEAVDWRGQAEEEDAVGEGV